MSNYFVLIVLELMYFFSHGGAFGLSVISNSELHKDRRELQSPSFGLEFFCHFLLTALALFESFWDIEKETSQLHKLFSGACVMSGLFGFYFFFFFFFFFGVT